MLAYQDRERSRLKDRASSAKDALFKGEESAAEEYMAIYQIEGGTRTYHDDRVVAAAVLDFEAGHPYKTIARSIVMPCSGLGVSEMTFAAALMDRGYSISSVVLMDRCHAWVEKCGVHECMQDKVIWASSYRELADVMSTLLNAVVIGFCALSGDEQSDPQYISFVESAVKHSCSPFLNYRTWTPDTYKGIMPYESVVSTPDGAVVGAVSVHEWTHASAPPSRMEMSNKSPSSPAAMRDIRESGSSHTRTTLSDSPTAHST